MRQSLLILQVFVLMFQMLTFIFSTHGELNFLIINISAFSVFISFIISWTLRNKTLIKGYGFSIIGFFVLMSWIVSFQIPLEIVYGNTDLLNSRFFLIYDLSIVNKLVAFSSLMLNLFLLGVTYSYIKIPKFVTLNSTSTSTSTIPTKPLLIIITLLLIIYIITVNPAYVNSGHGHAPMGTIAESAVGIALKLNAIYIALAIFNFRNKSTNTIKYVTSFSPIYLVLLSITIIMFLMAHNRSYVIMLASPLLFSVFIATNRRVSLTKVVLIFIALSSFATFFKIYGIDVFSQSNFELNEGLLVSKSFFPMTAELAASIYSSSILYSLYNEGISLYGMSFLVGLLRVMPGLVSFIDIDPISFSSGILATVVANTNYGVGTTPIFDLLINFGMLISLFIFTIVGYFFSKIEIKAYTDSYNVHSYIVYLSVCILILFYPRGSLNDLLQIVIFNLIFFKFYYSIFARKHRLASSTHDTV